MPVQLRPVHLKKIVCVDDNVLMLRVVESYLKSRGYCVVPCLSGKQALEVISKDAIDGVVVDYRMPAMDGGEVAAKVRLRSPQMPIVMFSGDEGIPSTTLELVDQFVLKGQANDLLSIADSLDFLLAKKSGRRSLRSHQSRTGLTEQLAKHSPARKASSRGRAIAT